MRRTSRLVPILALASISFGQIPPEFRTDVSKRSIPLDELQQGGPPKDGIPAIRNPKFVAVSAASSWLDPAEPVQVVRYAGEVRVYPLQILIWHELVNDSIGDLPLLVSFCPLCNAAVAFDRRVDGVTAEFGVSGLLRHSDMVMFDRATESLWQQLTGEGIVGEHTGKRLAVVGSQVVPFETVAANYPRALVLGRDTGHERPYGANPYEQYEPRGRMIFPVRYKKSRKIKPLERLLVFGSESRPRAYVLRQLRQRPVQQGGTGPGAYVVFYEPEMRTALGARRIAESSRVGAAGVYSPYIDGRRLDFAFVGGRFSDSQTSSTWNLLGLATAGPLEGTVLNPIEHGVYYAFAWLAFNPGTEVVELERR